MSEAAGTAIGVDGGGTWTRLAMAGAGEPVRRRGGATLVDPADPGAATDRLLDLIRRTADGAGLPLPAAGLCAGLAGTGDPGVRAAVRERLAAGGVAERVEVVTDGELALEAALRGEPGVVLVAGTGSVAYGRSPRGDTARCGGWGLVLGDEGSGYAIARAGLHAVLRALDGRGEPTALVARLLDATGLDRAEQVPAWAGRSTKADIAGLAPLIVELADDDAVAHRIVEGAGGDLARHVEALLERLGPWDGPARVVFLGSVLEQAGLARRVEERLRSAPHPVARAHAQEEPVDAALRRARTLR